MKNKLIFAESSLTEIRHQITQGLAEIFGITENAERHVTINYEEVMVLPNDSKSVDLDQILRAGEFLGVDTKSITIESDGGCNNLHELYVTFNL
jgi:hypothetical protein